MPFPLDYQLIQLTRIAYLGAINAEEFQIAMKSLGLNPSIQEVNELIAEVDPNNDGGIDFEGAPPF